MSQIPAILDFRDTNDIDELVFYLENKLNIYKTQMQDGSFRASIPSLIEVLKQRYSQLAKKIVRENMLDVGNHLLLVSTLVIDEKLGLTDSYAQFERSKGNCTFLTIEAEKFFISRYLEFKAPEFFLLKNHLLEVCTKEQNDQNGL